MSRGPLPCSLVSRPGDVITIVAGTFFAIPPGPTRAHRRVGHFLGDRTRLPTDFRPTNVLHVNEELDRVHRSIERTQQHRRTVAHGLHELLPGSAIPNGEPYLVGVPSEWVPHEAGTRVGPPLTDNEVRRQIGSGPPLAQGGRLWTSLEEQVAEIRSFLLGEGGRRHGRSLWKRRIARASRSGIGVTRSDNQVDRVVAPWPTSPETVMTRILDRLTRIRRSPRRRSTRGSRLGHSWSVTFSARASSSPDSAILCLTRPPRHPWWQYRLARPMT